MDEVYRLIFRGEVLAGQHRAVVKKRLAQSLELDAARADKLFGDRPVVLEREADTKKAAQLQALFKKAGARLRVLPVDASEPTRRGDARQPTPPAATPAADPTPGSAGRDSHLDVLPVRSEVLTGAERKTPPVAQVNTNHLTVRDVGSDLTDAKKRNVGTPTPETSYLSVADAGADMREPSAGIQTPVIEVDFEIAEVGADVLPGGPKKVEPEVDIDRDAFDLAEVGADIGQGVEKDAPTAPDISHLEVEAD